jgi:uncharacterized membrane protein YhaH (DUF805 family)
MPHAILPRMSVQSPDWASERVPPARMLFSLRGRIGRRSWWLWGVLALIAFVIYATVLLRVLGFSARQTDVAVNLLVLWPAIAVSVKRWHDRDKSGWWVLVSLLPLVGWVWALIQNGLLRGTPGPNRYGEPQ